MQLIKRIYRNNLLAISIGLVYLWFGTLKFFPHLSPAEGLAKDTIDQLSFGFIPPDISILLLALLEVGIGLFLILNLFRKTIIIIALFHMAFTFAPLILFSEQSFNYAPIVPTLLGQYIGKNLIIVGALLSLLPEKKRISA
ncbi:doxx family protein [Spongiimicrobium sp. 2-473A-2-J]|uniref:doxx family protein n=1 Tax=Eudoraea algarum TaxID=3417568 RepID=UPI003D35C99E